MPPHPDNDDRRVSRTAPESQSLSKAVWDYFDAQPDVTKRLRAAQRDLEAGKGTPYREVRRRR